MFDIGFQELVLIGLIGLVVVGPARLPKLAKTVGLYVNKMRRFVTDVRTDVERELHAEELRQSLSGNGEFDELKNVVNEARAGLDDVRASVNETRDELAQATSTPTDWSNPDAGPATDASAPAGATTLADGASQPPHGADAGGTADIGTSSSQNADSAGDGVGNMPDANQADANQADEPDEDVTTLNPRLHDAVGESVAQAAADAGAPAQSAAPAEPESQAAGEVRAGSGAPHDNNVSMLNESNRADIDDDDDDEDPTVFNAALASKREAGGKPD